MAQHTLRINSRLVSRPFILACSGGPDSIALAHYLKTNRSVSTLAGLLYIDHNQTKIKEPYEAVVDLATQLDVNFFVEYIPTPPKKCSLEHFWHDRRYEIYNQIARSGQADIVTAHHIDDAVETLMHGLVSGDGRKLDWFTPLDSEHFVLKPALATTKQSLKKYCDRNNLQYWLDPTNNHTNRPRNAWRKFFLHDGPKEIINGLRNRERQRLAPTNVTYGSQIQTSHPKILDNYYENK